MVWIILAQFQITDKVMGTRSPFQTVGVARVRESNPMPRWKDEKGGFMLERSIWHWLPSGQWPSAIFPRSAAQNAADLPNTSVNVFISVQIIRKRYNLLSLPESLNIIHWYANAKQLIFLRRTRWLGIKPHFCEYSTTLPLLSMNSW